MIILDKKNAQFVKTRVRYPGKVFCCTFFFESDRDWVHSKRIMDPKPMIALERPPRTGQLVQS